MSRAELTHVTYRNVGTHKLGEQLLLLPLHAFLVPGNNVLTGPLSVLGHRHFDEPVGVGMNHM